MQLIPGESLGPYKVLSFLASGGMGEVYRATDTRLGRTVAIKVVREGFGERFEREARTIANLRHSHICVVHDLGRHKGTDFLVMEYLEGKTLADRLRRGPLPLQDALRYGIEVADALDCAHRAGIIHRDLKPGNIMLTKEGAKLLDFGLAHRLQPPTGAPPSGSQAGTLPERLTLEGSIVGTLNYMAPEQLQGKDPGVRTDVFAFGAVLYEMIAGKRAFEGDSQASVISAIMQAEPPPLPVIEPSASPFINDVVRSCLSKDPEQRWRAVFDVAQCLRWAASGSAPPSPATRWTRGRALSLIVVLAIMAAILPASLFWRAPADLGVYHFPVLLPVGTRMSFSSSEGGVALSPDGRNLAFVATRGDRSGLWVRPLASREAQLIAGTGGASFPFWSADSQKIGFFADRKLKTVSTAGGPPTILCDAPEGRGGSWGKKGIIIFTPGLNDRVHKVSQDGGTPAPVTVLDPRRDEDAHYWPEFLSDDTRFLYFARSRSADRSGIAIASLETAGSVSQSGPILNTNSRAVYATLQQGRFGTRRSYLLFAREGILMAQPFDERKRSTFGEPHALAEPVAFLGNFGAALFSVSGKVLAYRESEYEDTQLAWVDLRGDVISNVGPPGHYSNPRLSPDQTRVAVERTDPATGVPDVWVVDLVRNSSTRFAFDRRFDGHPVWSPDGNSIIFNSDRHGPASLYRKRASGVGDDERLTEASYIQVPNSETADGKLLYSESHPETGHDIWMMAPYGDRRQTPLIRTRFNEMQAQVSPDGKFVAYASDESTRFEVYVQPFPDLSDRWPISTTGGQYPLWRRDGRQLFYVSAAGELMAVALEGARSAAPAGTPRRLFANSSLRQRSKDIDYRYDVSHDGTRFLMALPVNAPPGDSMTVVVNWAAKLTR